jgi:hypothetical protein
METPRFSRVLGKGRRLSAGSIRGLPPRRAGRVARAQFLDLPQHSVSSPWPSTAATDGREALELHSQEHDLPPRARREPQLRGCRGG